MFIRDFSPILLFANVLIATKETFLFLYLSKILPYKISILLVE